MTLQEPKPVPKTFTGKEWERATERCHGAGKIRTCHVRSTRVTDEINPHLKCLWNPMRTFDGKKRSAKKVKIFTDRGWHLYTIPSETVKGKLVQKKLVSHCEPWNVRGSKLQR